VKASKVKRTTLFAWCVFGLIVLVSVSAALLDAAAAPQGSSSLTWFAYLIGPAFALVGALILTYRPDNRVGWLMMLPGASAFVLLDAYLRPLIDGSAPLPPTLTPGLWLALWYSNWNWTLLIFPLLWLMLLFPTGRPISRRWGWLVWVGVVLTLFLLLLSTFGTPMSPGSGSADWSYPNPIGLIQAAQVDQSGVFTFFVAIMPVWVILCLAALVVRYRRAGPVERQQMKWLLLATAAFVAAYLPAFLVASWESETIWNVLWMAAMLLIPAAIGMAILRYRLFDIDVIIRKTLLYALLTALLALVYFGSVIVLQGLFSRLAGVEQSTLAVVISTLAIAALFTPLRRRIQDAIDRRFFRKKYNAQQVLAQFAQAARDETDLDALLAELVRVVDETLQPEHVSVWLKRQ
jgi:hypothetical protein